ncbi:MAG TPA: hypothetical protein VF616_30680 [Duganella sp.]|uniref:sugar phosphate isomerase/epimerase family protein n=1 Tax=Duganella sp. TaxID=1904440 RepID=UPI002ED056A9
MFRSNRSARAALAALALLGMGAARAEAPMPKIGVQLWSVKDDLRKDFDGTLGRLAAMGFEGVELAGQFGPYRKDAPGLRAALDKHRLRCAGAHVQLSQLSEKNFAATTAYYTTVGCANLIVPSDPRAATREGAALLAADLSALSPKLAPLGMRIGYHNHAEEMAGAPGREPWLVIGDGTPAATVLEQDVGWTSYAGKDPVAMVRRFPGRTVTTHYKAKIRPGADGAPIIGRDKADWPALIAANRGVGGTEWILVEQEEYPEGMAPLEAVEASMRGLQAIVAGRPAG